VGIIYLEGVEKVFDVEGSSVVALRHLAFDIRQGEFLVLVGPSGCGKSTILRILAGITTASAGTVRVGGKDPATSRLPIGMIFQTPVLLPWRSVLDNVLLPVEVMGGDMEGAVARARELLHLVGLRGFEEKRPYQLSGGMEQRVALCRALMNDPLLLLADEPFSALDALTRERLNLELQTVWMTARTTVVFVTHSIAEAVFLGDRVLVMSARPGRVDREVEVKLPRPRKLAVQDTPDFIHYTRHLRQGLEEVTASSERGGAS